MKKLLVSLLVCVIFVCGCAQKADMCDSCGNEEGVMTQVVVDELSDEEKELFEVDGETAILCEDCYGLLEEGREFDSSLDALKDVLEHANE